MMFPDCFVTFYCKFETKYLSYLSYILFFLTAIIRHHLVFGPNASSPHSSLSIICPHCPLCCFPPAACRSSACNMHTRCP